MSWSEPPSSDGFSSDPSNPPQDTPWRIWRRGEEVTLTEGAHSIGRGLDCRIVIESLGVSRLHAMLHASADALLIEDAGSTNGTFVNGQRVRLSRDLEHGDRILVGSSELVVLRADQVLRDSMLPSMSLAPTSSGAPPSPASAPTGTPVPLSGGAKRKSTRVPDHAVQTTLPSEARKPVTSDQVAASLQSALDPEEAPTQTVDPLVPLGRVADRMLASGQIAAAARMLGAHLNAVGNAVREGRPVPDSTVQTVASCSVKLAGATHDPAWLDLLLNIHIGLRRMLEPEVARRFSQTVSQGVAPDPALFRQYRAIVETLMAEGDEFDRMVGDMILASHPW